MIVRARTRERTFSILAFLPAASRRRAHELQLDGRALAFVGRTQRRRDALDLLQRGLLLDVRPVGLVRLDVRGDDSHEAVRGSVQQGQQLVVHFVIRPAVNGRDGVEDGIADVALVLRASQPVLDDRARHFAFGEVALLALTHGDVDQSAFHGRAVGNGAQNVSRESFRVFAIHERTRPNAIQVGASLHVEHDDQLALNALRLAVGSANDRRSEQFGGAPSTREVRPIGLEVRLTSRTGRIAAPRRLAVRGGRTATRRGRSVAIDGLRTRCGDHSLGFAERLAKSASRFGARLVVIQEDACGAARLEAALQPAMALGVMAKERTPGRTNRQRAALGRFLLHATTSVQDGGELAMQLADAPVIVGFFEETLKVSEVHCVRERTTEYNAH